MKSATDHLARVITRSSSKQSYYTACLLVDKDLVDDCCRAYGFFRWADDIIDLASLTRGQRIAFIERQKKLIEQLYCGEQPDDLRPEEEIIADLIRHDRGENSGLSSFIQKFLAILEFDAHRKGQLINQKELNWYSDCLGKAVTDAIQYFVGNYYRYPNSSDRYLAARAAHITHMLRDQVSDLDEGYINIPREYLEAHHISPHDVDSPAYREWVRGRVELARRYFREGKRYLDQLEVLRCKIAGYWYCARFECVLDALEVDGYRLRAHYNKRHKLTNKLKLVNLAISLTLRHISRRKWPVYTDSQEVPKDHRSFRLDKNTTN